MSIFAGHTRFVSRKTSSWNDQSVYGPPAKKSAAASSSRHTEFEPTLPSPVPPVSASPSSTLSSGWAPVPPPEQTHTTARQNGDFIPLSPGDNVQYPYVPSERTHHMEISPSSSSLPSYGWSSQPSYRQQDLPDIQYQSQPQRPLISAPLPPQQHPQYFQHHQLQLPQHSPQHPQQYQHQSHYETTPSFPAPPPSAAGALADLGLASRDSRLDARWSSFMEDSGLLDS